MSSKEMASSNSLMAAGIVLVLFGLLLLASPVTVGGAVVRIVAVILIITGLVQLFQSFRAPGKINMVVAALLGVIVAGVGVLVWNNPELGSGFLTGLLIIFFVVNGLWKVSTAIRYRRVSGWFWMLVSGLVSLLFVYLLWKQWPLSGAWAIGVLVGLDLLLTGIALIVLSFAARKVRSSGYVDTISL